ncbi:MULTISPECIES: glucose-1-phosphate adenylyltransferase [Rubrivivax]|uniref:Glucose-1-phosphate adenylyltransferase n=1 Tax=Rubrivivax benzoatilyticus TaxID=316997 RepID=A0ABX0HWI6_9BURK|nr:MULTISPECIES: glucose-1-phosphate adenylyltransferase [Rubrivivax]MCD0421397.1 glucose-1-phosphate adenylyltransferase [Rubrivivax sp. JA1024]EGJ09406.1 glucose-1-phosphate adenylyltransferase [Rubrivivax benzoatilyticus JA2 = ATCC BAA-35]MCC9597737.1 glucose-1-phosphate adenylyltransferase [Rubrivivax sp. JA1055]MCC9646005.1 glucose-1-phosphate adenylyltransferase [Rubrivivax sp. JA1029]NHK98149.1 glucose-1-phosphate adenylyltransferase [Rubrivivax benzoatilyticus]
MKPIDPASSFDLPRRSIALVLAGGRGSRLKNLTDNRAKPAVYFGGKFRIVDFALSNCLNSGIRRIGVITQYKSHSLLRHLQRGWAFLKSEMNEFVDLLPAQQRVDEESWYRGTADAVYQNQDILAAYKADYVVVLAGDHVYKQNYALMLADHVAQGRECTVGCIEVPRMEAVGFGVMHVDDNRRILDFVEKPADPPPMPGKPDKALASMGIYVFNARFLYRELERDMADPNSSHDFGKDIIPKMVRAGVAVAHPFELSCVGTRAGTGPYWRDVGTIDAYWDANIDLTATDPLLNLYDTNWPIWTYQPQLPPAKFVHNQDDRRGLAIESMVSGGCIVSGAVYRSVLFSQVRVHSYAAVNWAVLLPGVQIGRHARVTRVVVDRDCVIPDGMVIGEDPAADAARFYRTESGIVLVTREMLRALQ